MTIQSEWDLFNGEQVKYRRTMPKSERAPKDKSKFRHGQFIAWDGEGITDEYDRHHLLYFANSRGDAVRGTLDSAGRIAAGVSSKEAFTALLQSAANNPKAIHVIYYGSYDYNMLLRDLSRTALERLNQGQRAFWDDYSLQVRFGKELWVKDRNTEQTVTLWDVGSFFQQSFVKSLAAWDIGISDSVLDNIKAQKDARSSFKVEDLAAIEEYCGQELDALVRLMVKFRDALAEAGITINKWYGPGAIAGSLYRHHRTKSHKADTDARVNRAAQYAYGGGRIEPIRKGHYSGRCHYYDIRSAYPAAIAELPSLASASWKVCSSSEPESVPFSLYRIRWNFQAGEKFYPLRHRYASGNVCYPQTGIGTWVWTPEYDLCREFYPEQFTVDEALIFQPGNSEKPFEWVRDMYYQRQQWKQEGRAAERILKLGLNSLYGKMIQQLGADIEVMPDGSKELRKLPAYHQLEWGGYVTSQCRAQLFRAARTNVASVVGFETDGIITTGPLAVRETADLGDWECESFSGITYVQSGFYWLDKPDGSVKVKYRGFDPGSVTRNDVLNAWRTNAETLTARLTRHIGLAYALHTNFSQWGNWITSNRELDVASASSKRIHVCEDYACRSTGLSMADGLHDTDPYGMGVVFSAPYPLDWIDEAPEWKIASRAFDLELGDFDSYRFA